MNKKGVIKFATFSLLLIAIISVSIFALTVGGVDGEREIQEHTPLVTIDPQYANCQEDVPNEFTINIKNTAGFGVYNVKVYKSLTNIEELTCGEAPLGWDFNGFKFGLYCEYETDPEGEDVIEAGEELDFTFEATIDRTQCISSFRISTLDNEAILNGIDSNDGEEKNSFVNLTIDCSNPRIDKMINAPHIKLDSQCDENDMNSNGEVCDFWVSGETEINFWASDEDAILNEDPLLRCDAGLKECEQVILLDGVEIDRMTIDEDFHWDVQFDEDSNHEIKIVCVDNAGNTAELEELDKVDKTPPETKKTFIGPLREIENEDGKIVEWIDGITEIELMSEDPDPSEMQCSIGVDKIWYGVFLSESEGPCWDGNELPEDEVVVMGERGVSWDDGCVPYVDSPYEQDGNCIEKAQEFCELDEEFEHGTEEWFDCVEEYIDEFCDISSDWKLYRPGETIKDIEESCHVMQFFAVDHLGNKEDMNVNCFFVDKTAPIIEKEVGNPNKLCDEEEDCDYHVGANTNISLWCKDQEPHPSDNVTIYWRTRFDDEGDGFEDESWSEFSHNGEHVDFTFTESSKHELEYWCVDAVNKSSQHFREIDKVDAEAPVIMKKMLGVENEDWIGDCPPNSEGDKCYVADNGIGGVEVWVSDPNPVHASGLDLCVYQVEWEGEIIESGEFEEHINIRFFRDSTHVLNISCYDNVGNAIHHEETFLVDSEPPETTKTYGEPLFSCYDWCKLECGNEVQENGNGNGCVEECLINECGGYDNNGHLYPQWINNNTKITLTAEDEKVGTEKIFWRNTIVPDIYCEQAYYCMPCEDTIDDGVVCDEFNMAEGDMTMFFKANESCHLIEYYSVDKLGNTEKLNWQCVFVDNTAPMTMKEIGEPKVLMCPVDGENGDGELLLLLNGPPLPGTNLRQINGSYSQLCSTNTGIAFDGTNLIMSCWNHNNLDFLDPVDGSLDHTLDIPGYDGLHANAWDGTRNKLWQCAEHSKVLLVDTSDGSSILYTYDGIQCTDGLAYDGSDDTLWISPDVSSTVYHYKINNDSTLTRIGTHPLGSLIGGIYGNSGIAVGGDKLYLANNGGSQIYEAEKDLSNSTLFASFPERLEDMECDDITFASQGVGAIWSQDAYDRIINAYAIPQGKCGFGGLPPAPMCEDPMVFITHDTVITISCEDKGNHPVDHETIHWRIKIDNGVDESVWGDWQWSDENSVDIQFREDSAHMIEYFCEDALGNKEETKMEIDFVDTVAPEIVKTIVGPYYGQCPPQNEEDECIIDGETKIHVEAIDPEPHPVGKVTCDWSYEVIDAQGAGGEQGVIPPFDIQFPEESTHELWITCRDGLGNEVEDHETFVVDKTKPVTTKTLRGPIFTCYDWCVAEGLDHESCLEVCEFDEEKQEWFPQWINNDTWIVLEVSDEGVHKSGIKETNYRVSLIDDRYCEMKDVEEFNCEDAIGTGVYKKYTGEPFHINEDSCHLIEYYSVDNVNKTERVNKQCVFVDNLAPKTNKTIGEPKDEWTPGENDDPLSVFYPEETKHCWDETGEEIECWEVSIMTPITLDCKDPEPHPVDHETICFNVGFDGDDITADYCSKVDGTYNETGDGYCCMLGKEAPIDIVFTEESEHNLKFYCEDILGNRGAVDEEKFKVEGKPFEIWLNKKWNLISTPVKLLDDSMDDAFNNPNPLVESVWQFDGVDWHVYTPDGNSLNDDITTMEPGWGYWVLTNNMTKIIIGGSLISPAMTPPSNPVVSGWNLLGYYGVNGPGCPENGCTGYHEPEGNGDIAACVFNTLGIEIFDKAFTSLWTYWEPDNPNQWMPLGKDDNLDPGAGYWLFAQEEGIYAPSTTCDGFFI